MKYHLNTEKISPKFDSEKVYELHTIFNDDGDKIMALEINEYNITMIVRKFSEMDWILNGDGLTSRPGIYFYYGEFDEIWNDIDNEFKRIWQILINEDINITLLKTITKKC